MKYRLVAFECDAHTGMRTVLDILEVEEGSRGCSTPERAIAKLLRSAVKHGIDLTQPFEIMNL